MLVAFLTFISSAFAPTATMPGPVRWFALAWTGAILAVAYAAATIVYRRRISQRRQEDRIP